MLVNSVEARLIVNSHKKNGGLFGYNDVKQTFNGYDQNGNENWTLNCYDPGFASCRVRSTAMAMPSDPIEAETLTAMVNSHNSAFGWVENEIDNNNQASGTALKHYLVQLSNNTYIDIYVQISWQPDPNDSSATIINAEVYTA